jgi:hypothetical protein
MQKGNDMKILELINIYLLKNRELIFFLLEEIKQCIPQKSWDAYFNQINCIEKIQWVLGKEVDLYYHKDCKDIKLFNQNEVQVATINIDTNNKRYRINVFALDGKIFSFESNIPFKRLLISDIKNIEIHC